MCLNVVTIFSKKYTLGPNDQDPAKNAISSILLQLMGLAYGSKCLTCMSHRLCRLLEEFVVGCKQSQLQFGLCTNSQGWAYIRLFQDQLFDHLYKKMLFPLCIPRHQQKHHAKSPRTLRDVQRFLQTLLWILKSCYITIKSTWNMTNFLKFGLEPFDLHQTYGGLVSL